jgi:hypothetical protein
MLPSAALQLFDAKARGDGKRIVARRGCAMMFTALWLTGARPELFPVMIWLAFGLLSAKQTSAAPSVGEAKAALTY